MGQSRTKRSKRAHKVVAMHSHCAAALLLCAAVSMVCVRGFAPDCGLPAAVRGGGAGGEGGGSAIAPATGGGAPARVVRMEERPRGPTAKAPAGVRHRRRRRSSTLLSALSPSSSLLSQPPICSIDHSSSSSCSSSCRSNALGGGAGRRRSGRAKGRPATMLEGWRAPQSSGVYFSGQSQKKLRRPRWWPFKARNTRTLPNNRTRQPAKPEETMCACGSGVPYAMCCLRLHSGFDDALTPTELLRARYSAYVYRLPKFIMSTTLRSGEEWDNDEAGWLDELLDFCDDYRFMEIDIPPERRAGSAVAIVTFSVVVERCKRPLKGLITEDYFKERARFVKEGARWFYDSGSMLEFTTWNKPVKTVVQDTGRFFSFNDFW